MSDETVFEVELVSAIAALNNPGLDSVNPFHKNKYVSLLSALRTVKPVLSEHNLALVQVFRMEPDRVVTQIRHTSGAFLEDGGIPIYCKDKLNPQALGSSISYARRYGILTLLGLVGDPDADDDAHGAMPDEIVEEQRQEKIKKGEIVEAKDSTAETTEQEGGTDWAAFAAEHQLGFLKLKAVPELQRWLAIYQDQLKIMKEESPKLLKVLEAFYDVRFNVLANQKGD